MKQKIYLPVFLLVIAFSIITAPLVQIVEAVSLKKSSDLDVSIKLTEDILQADGGALELQVTNTSSERLYNISVNLTIPEGISYQDSLPVINYPSDTIYRPTKVISNTVEWEAIADLLPNESIRLHARVAAQGQPLLFIGQSIDFKVLAGVAFNPVLKNQELEEQQLTTIIQGARLNVSEGAYSWNALVGKPTEQIITIENNPEVDANSTKPITLTQESEYGLEIIPSEQNQIPLPDQLGNKTIWNLPTLTTEQFLNPLQILYSVLPQYKKDSGAVVEQNELLEISHKLDVTYSGEAGKIVNEPIIAKTVFRSKYITITKSVDKHEINPGDVITFILKVETSPHYDFSSVKITDYLSDGLTFLNAQTESIRSMENASTKLVWNVKDLNPGTTTQISYTAKVEDSYADLEDLHSADWFNDVSVVTGEWTSTQDVREGTAEENSDRLIHTPLIQTDTFVWKERTGEWVQETITRKNYPVALKFTAQIPERVPAKNIQLLFYIPTFLQLDEQSMLLKFIDGNSDTQSTKLNSEGIPHILVELGNAQENTKVELYINGKVSSDEDLISGTTLRTLTRVFYENTAEEIQHSASQATFIIQNPKVSLELEDGRPYAKQSLVSKLVNVSLADAVTQAYIRYSYTDLATNQTKTGEWEDWDVYDHQTKQTFDYVFGTEDGPKEICAEIKDSFGTVSEKGCDQIILDSSAPIGSVILDNGALESEDSLVMGQITTVSEISTTNSGQSITEWLAQNPDDKKVTICHYPPGNPENSIEINISTKALKTHIDHHNDTIGSCANNSVSNVVYYSYSTNGSSWTEWKEMGNQSIEELIDFKNAVGEVNLYVRFKDQAGNISEIYSDSITIKTPDNLLIYDITYISLDPSTIPGGGLTLNAIPTTLEAERQYSLYLGVKNNGSLVWNPADTTNLQSWATTQPVNISYHWIDTATGSYYTYNGNRGFLDAQVSYSQTDMFVPIALVTPDKPGTYILQIDAIHEGVTWFSAQGNAMPEYTITITGDQTQSTGDGTIPDYVDEDFGIGQPLAINSQSSNCTVNVNAGIAIYTDILATQSTGITIPMNTEVRLVATWFNQSTRLTHAKIELSDGRSFWISNISVLSCIQIEQIVESEVITYTPSHICNARYMDVFLYPRWDASILASLSIGTSVYKVGVQDDWIKIITLSGQTGWIYQTFLCGGFDVIPTYNVYQELLFDRPYDSNTTIITSDFGTRNGDLHDGVDYGISCGTEIQAIADGTVLEVFTQGIVAGNESSETTPANYIKIVHQNGLYQSWYWHLNAVNVIPGQIVLKGDVIGLSGNTGYVRGNPEDPIEEQGCHLHFEIRSNDDRLVDLTDYFAVDPELLLQFGDLSSELTQIIAWREGNYGQLSESDIRNSTYVNLVPVYRFWNPERKSHFYTIDNVERINLQSQSTLWTYEGPVFYAYPKTGCSGISRVYRFLNVVTLKHVFTANPLNEGAVTNAFKLGINGIAGNYQFEGVAFCAFRESDAGFEIAKPVTRFWSTPYAVHFLTIDDQEKNNIITNDADNWTYEGTAFYAFPVKAYLDWKVALETRELQAGEIIQDQGELCGSTKLVIYKDGKHVADNVLNFFTKNFVRIAAPLFADAYYQTTMNEYCKNLGLPSKEAQTITIHTTKGSYQVFDKGAIYSSDKGTFAIFGTIKTQFDKQSSRYGFPIGKAERRDDMICQNFELGFLCDSTEPFYLAIKAKESELQARQPVDFITTECNLKIQRYNSILNSVGAIVYDTTSKKAYTMISHMWNEFNKKGGCSVFGSPKTDTLPTAGNTGEYQHFENANIYWSNSHVNSQPGIVKGAIRDYYEGLGGTAHQLEFPERDQRAAQSTCGAKGYHQNFTNGKIYTSPIGTIDLEWNENWLNKYAFRLGEVEGELGWPKEKLKKENGVERMYFEKGYIEGQWRLGSWSSVPVVTGCEKHPACVEGEEWSDDEWKCVNSCGVGYIRKNGRCMKDFLGGSVHPLANDARCIGADRVYSGPEGVGDDDFGPRVEYPDHIGVDVRSLNGSTKENILPCDVNTVADGYVEISRTDGTGANFVDIKHNSTFTTRYVHGSSLPLKIGNKVNIDSIVFPYGCTGILCGGPHLHLELYEDGKAVDVQELKYLGYLGGTRDDYYSTNIKEDSGEFYSKTKQY